VVSLGARGCIARGRHGGLGACPAPHVTVIDTIGAGDYFTSGFLHAYIHGCSLQQCAVAGCSAGAEAVQTQGALLSEAAWQRLRAAVAGAAAENCNGSSSRSSTSSSSKLGLMVGSMRAEQQQSLVNAAVEAAAGVA
jgi:hypothetical protein